MNEEILRLMSEIHILSHSTDIDFEKLRLLWQKMYLYEMQHPNVIQDRDAFSFLHYHSKKDFWKMHDNAKSLPIYFENKQYTLQLEDLKPLFDSDFSTEKERLEYHIKRAIFYAMNEIKCRRNITSTSLYHFCRFCSDRIADYLENEDYVVKVFSVQDSFSPRVGHFACLVQLPQSIPYIIDMTYRQFFHLAGCMEEARFHADEPYIAPGYFIDTKEKQELLAPLLSSGYFACTNDVLKAYADSFAFAEQSVGQGPKLMLTPPKNTAENYLQAVLDAPRIKY